MPVEDIRRFESEFLDYLRREQSGVLTAIRETNVLSNDDATSLQDAMNRFRRSFEVAGGQLLVSDEEQVSALGEGEHGQETVPRYAQAAPADGE